MIVRLLNRWSLIRSSLWFVPSVMSAVAVALAVSTHSLDHLVAAEAPDWIKAALFQGDATGARVLLSTVAGSMIGVAGTTFSVTVVALSLASSQFGPRLLVNFMRDRSNQLVLGTFIATFLYCLVALGQDVDDGVLPSVSAPVGLLLALASVGVLIFFIHHIASNIRAEHVIDVVARDIESVVDKYFDADSSDSAEHEEPNYREELGDDFALVRSRQLGYIQVIDEESILRQARAAQVVVHLLRRPGNFLVDDEPLAAIYPASRLTEALSDGLRSTLIIGRFRTGEDDPEYGIHQLVEVAVRALSPGINDPNTAVSCIDWLAAMMHRIANRQNRPNGRFDEEGELRMVVESVDFKGLIAASFNQIRQNSYRTPAVAIRLLEALETIGRDLHHADRIRAVRTQADSLFSGALAQEPEPADCRVLEDRHRRVLESLGRT